MKKLLIFLCFFGFTAFTFASCRGKDDAKLDKTYTDNELGFSVSYPSGWTQSDYEPGVVFFQAPQRSGFSASFGIVTDAPADPRFDNLTKEDFLKEIPEEIRDLKLLDFQKITFAGKPCTTAVFDSVRDSGKLRQKQYLFNRNGRLFTIIFTSLRSDYEYYSQLFDKIAQSLVFTGNSGAGG